MTSRPFRFGIIVKGCQTTRDLVDRAKLAEAHGYSSVMVNDHVVDVPLAPITSLAVVATAIARIRIGSLVLCNDFRHPVMTIHELATINELSGGRLEIGIGAGWLTADYAISGLVLDRPGVRIERLAETVDIIDLVYATDGPISFHGKHYRIEDYELPAALRRAGRPPLIMGGGGPRMLGLAARHADVVGLIADMRAGHLGAEMGATMRRQASIQKRDVVRMAAPERFETIELLNLVFDGHIGPSYSQDLDRLAQKVGLTPQQAMGAEGLLLGPVGMIVEELCARREAADVSYIVVADKFLEQFAPVVEALSGR